MKKKYYKWALVLIWMAIIFIFSNQPAVISDEKSRFVINLFKFLGLNLDSMLGAMANFIVRKAAHFSEYFILYFLIFYALRDSYNVKKSLIIALGITFLYASSDEIHQTFIPGREGRFRDVLIDTFGGFICMTILSIFYRIKRKP